MNQQLTEKVLASVMDWGTIEVAENIRGLEHIADLKYDQYQQYEVGSRFIENLVIWLSQFENVKESGRPPPVVPSRFFRYGNIPG